MRDLLRPYIECRLEENSFQKRISDDICSYIRHEPNASAERFYAACNFLLRDRNTERIALYLPFWVLKEAPDSFRDSYLNAWHHLLCFKDVRENFHLGDCFELDARPLGGLERVIKCAHLTPWLLEYGYLEPWHIINILDANPIDSLMRRSFSETWNYIYQKNIISNCDLRRLSEFTRDVAERRKLDPLYVSEKRKLWLRERNAPFSPLISNAKLEGPFSDNIPYLDKDLDLVARSLYSKDILLVGGSKLKGYGGKHSDFDLWSLKCLTSDKEMAPGSPHAIHIYFNTLWLGKTGTQCEMESVRAGVVEEYSKLVGEPRRLSIERLESDLLLYRLLHKGYANFKNMKEFGVPEEMDGDCPFYDDGYREVATMLFAKYVWL